MSSIRYILSWASFLGASVVYENVPPQHSVLPATDGLEIEERVALSFSSLDSLKRAMAQPMPIDEAYFKRTNEQTT